MPDAVGTELLIVFSDQIIHLMSPGLIIRVYRCIVFDNDTDILFFGSLFSIRSGKPIIDNISEMNTGFFVVFFFFVVPRIR